MKKLFLFIALVLGTGLMMPNSAQQSKPLNIGDTLPNISMGETVNYRGQEETLSDFKGKILILDFWATWCVPCIAAFPKMEMLRKKYKDRLEIIPITTDGAEKVRPLFANLKKDRQLDLFSVVGDQRISKLFNFQFLPHYVIIGKDGKYLTDAKVEEINESSVEELIKSGNGNFSTLKTVVTKYDYTKPLFNQFLSLTEDKVSVKRNLKTEQLVVTSTLARNISNLSGPRMINNNRVLFTKTTLEKIYGQLFGAALAGKNDFYFMPDNRRIWEVRDKKLFEYSNQAINKLVFKKEANWRDDFERHQFSYEMRANDTIGRIQMAKMALNDLNNKFKVLYNLSASVEKRKVKCLVLKRTSTINKISATTGIREKSTIDVRSSVYDSVIKGQPFRQFMLQLVVLNLQNIKTPILDETGFNQSEIVDIKLEGKTSDWKTINVELAKYDLVFEEMEREIDMVIISDTKPIMLVL